jgi:hypothetical protein
MQPPDIETRMAILRRKAEEFHIELGEDVLAFLAQRVRTNVRRLEGALMRVASYLSLSGREISCETVEQLLWDILREKAKKRVTIDQIQKKVAEQFDVRLAGMTIPQCLARERTDHPRTGDFPYRRSPRIDSRERKVESVKLIFSKNNIDIVGTERASGARSIQCKLRSCAHCGSDATRDPLFSLQTRLPSIQGNVDCVFSVGKNDIL